MKIDDATVAKMAHLAKLEFSEAAAETIKADLNKIIEFVDKLEELDTENVEPLLHITKEVNVMREDVVANEVSQKEALKNGPDTNSDYFRVPKVLDK